MRQLKVTKTTGSGTIDQIHEGWSVQCATTPTEIGGDTRLGSASFSVERDGDSKFLIDNDVQIRQTDLGGFDGNIREATLDEGSVDLSVNSILSRLDVERTAGVNAAGTFERNIVVPTNIPYVVNGTTYYTGSLGNFAPIIPLAIASDSNFIYVNGGGSAFPAINVFRIDGTYVTTFADWVTGDTAYAGPTDAQWMAVIGTTLYTMKSSRATIRRYDTSTGAYLGQWGTAGSGASQFNTPSGMTTDGSYIYASDSVNGRIQKFTSGGTYLMGWGSSGTGVGNTVFYVPHNITYKNGYIWVPDWNARVRRYDTVGTFVAGQLGQFNPTLSSGDGTFMRNTDISLMFDHHSDGTTLAYTISANVMKEWAFTTTTTPALTGRTWNVINRGSRGAVGTLRDGTLLVSGASGIDRYTGSLGSLAAIFQYYMALASPNMPIDFGILEPTKTPVYAGWTDNVWKQISDLAAATGNSITLWDSKVHFYTLGRARFTLPENVVQRPINLSSRPAGLSVTAVNYNSTFPDTPSVIYNADADNDGRIFSVDTNDFTYVNVNQGTYPTYMVPPAPAANLAPTGTSSYVVYDSASLIVTPSLWTAYGASITANVTSTPGSIQLLIKGPGYDIPGFTAPYRIGSLGGGRLQVYGVGVQTNPETLTVGTGVEPTVTSKAVAVAMDSVFCNDPAVTYTQASWVAYNSGTPEQTMNLTLDTKYAPKLQLFASGLPYLSNTMVLYDEAIWLVNTVNYNATNIQLQLRRHTPVSSAGYLNEPSFQEIWSGIPAGNFAAFWKGHTAQDLTIAPLRNPYGIPTRAV